MLASVSAQEGDFIELKTVESEKPGHRACRLVLVEKASQAFFKRLPCLGCRSVMEIMGKN